MLRKYCRWRQKHSARSSPAIIIARSVLVHQWYCSIYLTYFGKMLSTKSVAILSALTLGAVVLAGAYDGKVNLPTLNRRHVDTRHGPALTNA